MNEPDPRDPRLDVAYRDAANDQPPAAIDERIRAAARRAVAAGPQSLEARARADAQRSWVARWRVPVSIAATVVIAVTLSYMVQDEAVQKTQIDGLPSSAPPPAAAVAPAEEAKERAPAVAPKPVPAPLESAADAASARVVAPAAPPSPTDNQTRAAAERPRPLPAPEPARADAPAANGILAKESERRQAAGDPLPPPAPPAMRAAPATAVPAAPPPPAAAPAPAREAAAPAGRDRAFADRPDRMERGAASVSAEQKVRTPEEWLEELRRLKASGRTDEFVKDLAEFRKRYPDYKLPADLSP
jgi:hypothetical protein